MLMNMARDTAGLMWHPETLPTEYAIATMTRPKARAVRMYPPKFAVLHDVTTAVPQPKKTSTKVPIISAMYFLKESIINKVQNKLELKERNLLKEIAILESLNPLSVLTRGYSIVEKGEKRISKSADLNKDDEINIKFADGDVKGKVI